MKKERLKEIIDRLERIDHKEYCCGFEFADSGTFDETCRCFEERKELYNEVIRLREIIDKAKEWINENWGSYYAECGEGREDLLDILKENNLC